MSAADASTLMIGGSVVFLVGASIGVPGVFMESDAEARLQLLERHLLLWRVAQPLYVIGPLIAAIGVGVLASSVDADTSWLAASCALLVIGVAFWAGDALPRMVRHRAFALGQLPWWPFVAYVWLTIAGLATLGIGGSVAGYPGWVVWTTLIADGAFAGFFLVTRDIPPFFFYLLLIIVGWGIR